jgi:hypothetical protein
MPSSAMLRRVALVRGAVSEERITFIIRVKRISELRTTLAVTSKFSLIFHHDYRGDTFLRNVSSNKSHTLSHIRRRHSSAKYLYTAISRGRLLKGRHLWVSTFIPAVETASKANWTLPVLRFSMRVNEYYEQGYQWSQYDHRRNGRRTIRS